MNSSNVAMICKALGDSNRLQIVHILADGEKCGCELLEAFDITQPTLSHHMSILSECNLIQDRKVGKWHHYLLNYDTLLSFQEYINTLTESDTTTESGCCEK